VGLGSLKRKLEVAAVGKIVAIGIKMLAEGKFGKPPAAVYWWLAGKKTFIAIVLAAVYGALYQAHERGLCAPCADWSGWLLGAAAFMATIGIVDGAVRIEPPQKP
jgi:hypothetical protein